MHCDLLIFYYFMHCDLYILNDQYASACIHITTVSHSQVRGISRDTWNMFLYLTESLNEDLSNYNDNEAWPSLFDDFVDYQRDIMKQKVCRCKIKFTA